MRWAGIITNSDVGEDAEMNAIRKKTFEGDD